jgi:hypothetical protein
MPDINPLRELWKDHETDRFPESCRGRDVEGRDLELLTREVEGGIMAALGEAPGMEAVVRPALEQGESDLSVVISRLSEEEKEYFGRLWVMAKMALEII